MHLNSIETISSKYPVAEVVYTVSSLLVDLFSKKILAAVGCISFF